MFGEIDSKYFCVSNSDDFLLDTVGGTDIRNAISEAISLSVIYQRQISFKFNNVIIRVAQDSDKDLIYRDWDRVSSGYIEGPVGPYPNASLTKEEIESDRSIQRSNRIERERQQREWQRQQDEKQAAINAMLENADDIKLLDAEKWEQWVSNNRDPYGKAIIDFARQWARMMQVEIDHGSTVEDAARKTEHDADTFGLSGFGFSAALHILREVWVYGRSLQNYR